VARSDVHRDGRQQQDRRRQDSVAFPPHRHEFSLADAVADMDVLLALLGDIGRRVARQVKDFPRGLDLYISNI